MEEPNHESPHRNRNRRRIVCERNAGRCAEYGADDEGLTVAEQHQQEQQPTVPSGTEAPSAAANQHAQISGTGKFCKPRSANGRLDCRYASMSACQKHNSSNNLHCVANPKTGT
jgi:hypothetical protein